MSAITTLQNADSKLAAQLDAVTAAVQTIGSQTHAAKERLAAALEEARDRLNQAVNDVADAVALTSDLFDDLVGCGLLAMPQPAPVEPAAIANDEKDMDDGVTKEVVALTQPDQISDGQMDVAKLMGDPPPDYLDDADPQQALAEVMAGTSSDTAEAAAESDNFGKTVTSAIEKELMPTAPVNRIDEAMHAATGGNGATGKKRRKKT